MTSRPIRVLVAKPGLDGHDRGAKIVAQALMEAGMEVIYTGLHQAPEEIVKAALEEDVNVIGLSILSGAHIPIAQALNALLPKETKDSMLLMFGGNIPAADTPELEKLGVHKVFRTSTNLDEIIQFIRDFVSK